MDICDIIRKKRDGQKLTSREIDFWIQGYVGGEIADYQSSALLMAAFINGLDEEETVNLTYSLLHSGELLDLSSIPGIKADKHSTGGIGDKTTLIVAPILAAGGLKVAKMSGRGLGYTGGTLDKLTSIPGMRVDLDMDEFMTMVQERSLSVIGQTVDLVPGDKLLYALRDVTATVDSIPLIASSIMSKKLACGADIIVLDVKYGSGAFMKDLSQGRQLAQMMVEIGKKLGKKVTAVLSSMEQPLGKSVGNALEVKEAVDILKNRGDEDLRELCCLLAGEIFFLADKAVNQQEGRQIAEQLLADGQALAYFRSFLDGQGGDGKIIDNPYLLPMTPCSLIFTAEKAGYIDKMDGEAIGKASLALGAGRKLKTDAIDPAAGIVFEKKLADKVVKGDILAWLYASNENKCLDGLSILKQAIHIGEVEPEKDPLIADIIRP